MQGRVPDEAPGSKTKFFTVTVWDEEVWFVPVPIRDARFDVQMAPVDKERFNMNAAF